MINELDKYMKAELRNDLISAIGWFVLWFIVRSYVNSHVT